MSLLENFNIPWNTDIPWNIGGILGDSPGILGGTLDYLELNTLTKYSMEYDIEHSIEEI